MKVIVTGASGFVGTYLCEHAREQGDEVLSFGPEAPGFMDVLDREGVRRAVVDSGADALYHLAAFSSAGASFDNPVETLRVNVEGTLNVLDACAEEGVERVLVVGSAEEYGGASAGVARLNEEAPLRPITLYGASKVAAEFLALQAHLSSGLGTIMTRSFNHTGAGQLPAFVVPAMAQRIARAEKSGGDEIEVGRLDSVREFNDVRDVVRAYRLLIQHGRPGCVYNVCSGVGYTVEEVVRRLIELSARPIKLRPNPALVRKAESNRLVGDPGRLEAETRWRPSYSLDETLKAVLAEARAAVDQASPAGM